MAVREEVEIIGKAGLLSVLFVDMTKTFLESPDPFYQGMAIVSGGMMAFSIAAVGDAVAKLLEPKEEIKAETYEHD